MWYKKKIEYDKKENNKKRIFLSLLKVESFFEGISNQMTFAFGILQAPFLPLWLLLPFLPHQKQFGAGQKQFGASQWFLVENVT